MPRFLLLLALLAPTAALAQPAEAPTTLLQDEAAAVRAAVHELWEAMRTSDADRARAVLHPDARGYSAGVQDGQVMLQQIASLEGFIDAIGAPKEAGWDERVFNEEVRVDGPLATYYTEYELWVGEDRIHCGVDAFQLVRTDEAGWQIFVLTDTRRACE